MHCRNMLETTFKPYRPKKLQVHVRTSGVYSVIKVYGDVITNIPPLASKVLQRNRNKLGSGSLQIRFAASTQPKFSRSLSSQQASPTRKDARERS